MYLLQYLYPFLLVSLLFSILHASLESGTEEVGMFARGQQALLLVTPIAHIFLFTWDSTKFYGLETTVVILLVGVDPVKPPRLNSPKFDF